MSKSVVYKSAEISVETELDGEIALMNIDSGDFFALKDTALQIWRRIDGVADQDAIIRELCAEYDVEYDVCSAQVAKFCDSLLQAGLIVAA